MMHGALQATHERASAVASKKKNSGRRTDVGHSDRYVSSVSRRVAIIMQS
jgi:hypothetical protein